MSPTFDEIFAIRLSLQDYIFDEFTIIRRLKIILQDYNMNLENINEYLVEFYNSFGLTFTLEDIQNINVEANSLLSLFLTNGDVQMTINENNPQDNINITSLLDNIINQSNNIINQSNNINNITPNNIETENYNSDDSNSDDSNSDDSNSDDSNSEDSNLTNPTNPANPANPVNLPSLLINQNINNLPVFINDIQNIVPQNMILTSELNMFNTIINFINQSNQVNNINYTNNQEDNFDEDVLVTLDEKELADLNKELVETKQKDRCTICLQDINPGEYMTTLKCSHYYHYECITEYLKEFDYKCPICREDVGKTYAHV